MRLRAAGGSYMQHVIEWWHELLGILETVVGIIGGVSFIIVALSAASVVIVLFIVAIYHVAHGEH
jgi:hypothetical protein